MHVIPVAVLSCSLLLKKSSDLQELPSCFKKKKCGRFACRCSLCPCQAGALRLETWSPAALAWAGLQATLALSGSVGSGLSCFIFCSTGVPRGITALFTQAGLQQCRIIKTHESIWCGRSLAEQWPTTVPSSHTCMTSHVGAGNLPLLLVHCF